ncbi:hypothetical protein [Cupriavidus oxalaticus]|uniref:hypothetical protein n=1 Tax=Cupriavidus oxalaticus TaxID=96344 RepID=UPI00197AD07F|nr:hypothetical protein [Cupriavidus oxalaticus]
MSIVQTGSYAASKAHDALLCESVIANTLAPQVTDFASMAGVIGQRCHRGLIVVLDESQYFTHARL